jgi:hypothetical protein
LPICEITVGVPSSNGAGCSLDASTDRPRNITPSSEPMMTRVVRALRQAGSLNAGTPLEIASTPVTAAPPEAKAWSTTASVAP